MGQMVAKLLLICATMFKKLLMLLTLLRLKPAISFDNAVTHGLISYVSEDVLDSFIKSTLRVSTRVDCSDLTVAYSPLNGTGLEFMQTNNEGYLC